MIRISVIVCTLDRAAYLQRALASLVRQTLARTAFEILVVDNGSTDDTAAVIGTFAGIVALNERRLGLSHARNTGLAHAQAPLVAFLDDDAEAAPDWLAAVLARFAAETPRPVCVGGPIDPIWDAPRPPWLADSMLPYLTILDWALPVGDLPPERYIAGANMAFDRAAVLAIGGFPTSLGRVGRSLLSNEELVVERALLARGGRCVWDPAVRVAHHVQPERLQRRWFLRRYYWQGVSDAVMSTDIAAASHRRRVALRQTVRWLAKAAVTRPASRFACTCEAVREAALAWHTRGARR